MSELKPFRLVVGLGNPGPDYQATRHNIGFRVVDELAPKEARWRSKFKSEHLDAALGGRTVTLIKPQTYMNLSGEAIRAWSDFFKLEPAQILVIHDDIDLPFARVKLSLGGGDGGNNGLKSLIQQLGSRDFARIRIGVGRPFYRLVERPAGDAADWVLSQFDAEERRELPALIAHAAAAVEESVAAGFKAAQMKYNRDEKREEER